MFSWPSSIYDLLALAAFGISFWNSRIILSIVNRIESFIMTTDELFEKLWEQARSSNKTDKR